jgi:hypothetical protein
VGMGMIQAMVSRVVTRARTQVMGDSSLVVEIAMILGIRLVGRRRVGAGNIRGVLGGRIIEKSRKQEAKL